MMIENLYNTINLSDNLQFLKTLPDDCIDSIITDSPYGLGKEPDAVKVLQDWITKDYHEVKGAGFMGKKWDAFVPQPILWKECFRVLKPGGHLLSFFGTRTYDWGTLAIRLAGFEIRDCIMWVYGSGFPKTKTALKPAFEPICVARKPGASTLLNIDECRIQYQNEEDLNKACSERPNTHNVKSISLQLGIDLNNRTERGNINGRWPSNVIIDEFASKILDSQTGISGGDNRKTKTNYSNTNDIAFVKHTNGFQTPCYNDKGGASRFFYVAKASPSERKGNNHPTVKPVKLMQQVVKLYTPKGGVCLDPHAGSGTTGVACKDWCNYILIDSDKFSYDIAFNRLKNKNELF